MTPARMAEIHAASFVTPRPWSEAELAGFLADPSIVSVDLPDGFAIGRVILDEAEVLTIAVDPAARRKGVGKRLLTGLLDTMALTGATTVHLEVAADNTPARALYIAAGFAEIGRRKGYYQSPEGTRVDALVMRRSGLPSSREV